MKPERSRSITTAKIVLVVLAAIPFLLWGHEYGPDAGYSGVPGEFGTCTAAGCDTGTTNNPANNGSVAVNFPNGKTYTPGVKQHLTVTVADPAATERAWGFQLTARQASNAAAMAGSFTSVDASTGVQCASVTNPADGLGQLLTLGQTQTCPANKTLAYIEHTLTGYTTTKGQTGSATFQFDWTPSSTNVGDLVMYVAATAANGDLTPSVDHIYAARYTLSSATSAGCTPPLCVSSTADNAATPTPGGLRYAILNAPAGATITFDPALNGQAITLDTSSPNNHIKITQDVTIQGPGSGLLTISGGNLTRIFFVAGGTVTISGLTLANGFAKGGDGADGGGGAAGMGGAIFLNGGSLTLSSVALSGNQARGGNGGTFPCCGGGGGFGGNGTLDGGSGGDLGGNGGAHGSISASSIGADGGPGGGGGPGGSGGSGGFGGGGGAGGGPGGPGGFGAGGGGGAGGSTGGFGGGNGSPTFWVFGYGGFGGGGGGAGLGGAIFVSTGGLQLLNTSFVNNSTAAGATGYSAGNGGHAKGGALFICAPSFCGAGHNGSAILQGNLSFQGNLAADAGTTPTCPGRDDVDVCGAFSAQTATKFSVFAPGTVFPGVSFTFTVSAVDANNNLVFTYSGKVHFSSSDPLAGLPPDSTLTSGMGTFAAVLQTSGNQTISATDTVATSLTGTSNPIAVAATTPTHFSISAPAAATPGVPFNVTVTALDANNLVVVLYAGKVHFTSTDAFASLPGDTTLSQGVGTFSATLATGPSQTITATDSTTASITGTSSPITVSISGVSLAAVSALPAASSGLVQTFAFSFSDPFGWRDLSVVNVLINNSLDGRQACYLAYVVPSGSLFLVDDEGDAGGPFAGSQNSQCAASVASATGDGGTLKLTLNITFKPAFGGNKIVYLAARDSVQNNTGWQALGVWQVPFTPAGTISAGSATPARGAGTSGTPQAVTLTLTDTKGAADIGIVNLLVNNFLDGRQACYLAYAASSNTLLLVDDAGDAGGPFAGSMVLNGGGTIQNSQCSVNGAGSSAVLSGNLLTLTLNLAFKAGFTGSRILYAAGRDAAGGNNTNWQAVGTFTVQ